MIQIKAWAWKLFVAPMLPMEVAGVICAMWLAGFGLFMVWEAVGIHETSRFRGKVDKALEREIAAGWSFGTLMGFVAWLLAMAAAIGLITRFYIYRDNEQLMQVVAGAGLGVIAGLAFLRVIRRRRQLFVSVFLPSAVGAFVYVWVALYYSLAGYAEVVLGFGILAGLCLFMTTAASLFLGVGKHADPNAPRRFPGNPRQQALGGLAVFVGLMVLFHLVENWRGRREWARVKTELTAKGEVLDYAAYLKPPVPPGQNVMEHPFMKAHFIKGRPAPPIGSPPFGEIGYANLAELKKLPARHSASLYLDDLPEVSAKHEKGDINFTNTPLAKVIESLARLTEVETVFLPHAEPFLHRGAVRLGQTPVTLSLTNVTALDALKRITSDYLLTVDADEWLKNKRLAFSQQAPSLEGILNYYNRSEAGFAQLEEALQRPNSRLPGNVRMPFDTPIPSYVACRTVVQSLVLRAKVHLLLGNPDAALRELRLVRRMMEVVLANEPPVLVGAMIRVAFAGLLSTTLEETLAEGLWPTTHLHDVQALCAQVDLISGVNHSLRGGERAGVLQSVEVILREDKSKFLISAWTTPEPSVPLHRIILGKLIPDGWVDQNLALYAHLMQARLESGNLTPSGLVSGEAGRSETDPDVAIGKTFRPYTIVANVAIPNFSKALQTTARNQTQMNHAYLACTLERHRAAHGAYPETLDALVPEFTAKLPQDIMSGQALRYRRTENGKYLLYSVGSNSRDDDGKMKTDAGGRPLRSDDTGDWVWQGVPKNLQD
jgi:hypothetical protein